MMKGKTGENATHHRDSQWQVEPCTLEGLITLSRVPRRRHPWGPTDSVRVGLIPGDIAGPLPLDHSSQARNEPVQASLGQAIPERGSAEVVEVRLRGCRTGA